LLQQQVRTRAVLAALGIPLWAVRGEPVQTVPKVSIWGQQDVHTPQVETVEVIQPIVNKININDEKPSSAKDQPTSNVVVSETKSVVSQVSVISSEKLEFNNNAKVQLENKPIRQPFTQTIVASEAVHVVQVVRFSLEARVIGNWVVLVSVQALNHPDRNALWKNLNQALVSGDNINQVGRLDWPLAEGSRWQHNDGAQAALMGFLSRFGSERRIGLMGELPDHVIPERLERLPSLDELLQEPLKKRTLWRLLTGTIR